MPHELIVNFTDRWFTRLQDVDAPGYWGFRWGRIDHDVPNAFCVFQYAGHSNKAMDSKAMVEACRLLVPSTTLVLESLSSFSVPLISVSNTDYVFLRLKAEPW